MIVSSFDLAYIGYFMKLSEDAMEVDGALGNGTAFMIDERGYMVTNNHVIKEARYIEVEFTWDGKIKTFPAKVVAVDKENDLAMLANGATFKRDSQGILPELVSGMFASRKAFKKKANGLAKEIEEVENAIAKLEKHQ